MYGKTSGLSERSRFLFRLAKSLPSGKGFVCLDTKNIPQILQQIFQSTVLSSKWFVFISWRKMWWSVQRLFVIITISSVFRRLWGHLCAQWIFAPKFMCSNVEQTHWIWTFIDHVHYLSMYNRRICTLVKWIKENNLYIYWSWNQSSFLYYCMKNLNRSLDVVLWKTKSNPRKPQAYNGIGLIRTRVIGTPGYTGRWLGNGFSESA